ncbi:MAG TPA: ABC transporter permease [Gammaproteobacteria bacterium]|nr:ABC transporter permease [Gammaproteobacteria bacterium]
MSSLSFLHDVRFAFRSLLNAPGVSFVVVLTLAVAIGANTAIFSVVESVLLQPLPYPDEDRIVRVAATVYESRGARGDRGNAFADRGYWHFANNQRSFEKFGGYYGPEQLPLTGDGPPRQVGVTYMTLSAFEVLGVSPELGRFPTSEEDARGGPSVVLLSHDLWVSQYGSDPAILGRTVDVNGTSREVIGVMPASYDFPTYPGPTLDVDGWIPFQLDPASTNFGSVYINAIARLAPGVTIEGATDDARSLVARLDEAGYPPSWFESIFDGGAVVRPFRDYVGENARQPLLIVLGTVGFVLLIACSNVANLLLVRAEGRRQENAVRMALGSGRARLARQMLIESTLLALVGGAAGVLLAYAGTRALVSLGPATSLPRLGEIGIDGAALAFTAVVSLLTGVLFGVLPAFRSSSMRTMGALRDGGRNATLGRDRHRTRNALVMTQVALAFVLVIGSGLMVRSFAALRSVDPGFATENVLTFTVQPLATKYEGVEAVAQFYEQLIERLEAVPGVTRAAAINALPFSIYRCCNVGTVIEEFPPAEGEVAPGFVTHRATPGYFEAMSIPVVEGRAFTAEDHNRRLGSVIISRSVKERYWPATSAVGKRITFGRVQTRVVGVVGDVHDLSLDLPADQNMYLPMLDAEGSPEGFIQLSGMALAVRTAVEPLSLVSAIRSAIAEVDPDVPMADIQTMQDVLGGSMTRTSFTMSLLVISALIALFLGAVGLYAVLSYVVSQRTPEIGIRSALGATPEAVRGMILSQGMRLAGVGVLIGLIVAVALGRVMLAQLYGVSPVDGVTLIAGSAIFLAVAGVASLLPAGRAARTSPVDALRAG